MRPCSFHTAISLYFILITSNTDDTQGWVNHFRIAPELAAVAALATIYYMPLDSLDRQRTPGYPAQSSVQAPTGCGQGFDPLRVCRAESF